MEKLQELVEGEKIELSKSIGKEIEKMNSDTEISDFFKLMQIETVFGDNKSTFTTNYLRNYLPEIYDALKKLGNQDAFLKYSNRVFEHATKGTDLPQKYLDNPTLNQFAQKARKAYKK